jgi:hypothetical protein
VNNKIFATKVRRMGIPDHFKYFSIEKLEEAIKKFELKIKTITIGNRRFVEIENSDINQLLKLLNDDYVTTLSDLDY